MSDRGEEVAPINRVRRREHAVDDESWIRAYLREAPFVTVATECEGQPFITPMNFAYDDEARTLYLHGARAGRLYENLGRNERVCVNACRMGAVIPADTASGFSLEYDSVTAFGRMRPVTEEGEARHGLRLLMEKYGEGLRPEVDYRDVSEGDLARTVVYRVDIEAWSGKRAG
jgi:nitroimidazol reductase NimA-like FMN-containing flavoprotein (pyridoxamine 5'-phosphate oxidase superfamily)